MASVEEEIKRIKVEAEELWTQRTEETARLDSTLVEIEALNIEVHESYVMWLC